MASPRAPIARTAPDDGLLARLAPWMTGHIRVAAWAIGIAAVLGLNAYKGAQSQIQVWGWPYWLVSYQDGLIRRGLAGEIFHLLFGETEPNALAGPILVQHWLCIDLLIAATAVVAGRILAKLDGRAALGLLGFAAWFLASQCWPTLANVTGYLDPLVMVLAVGAALFLRAGRIGAAAALAVIGPFVHEYFVFFLPFILASAIVAEPRDQMVPLDQASAGPSPRSLWIVAAVCIGAAAVSTFGADAKATASQITRMPQPQDIRDTLLNVTFTQGFASAFGHMAQQWTATPAKSLWNVAFFLTPALACSGGILFWRARPTGTAWLQVLAGLFPIAALLLAWDLSRLLVASNLTCGLLFLFVAEQRAEEAAPAVRGRRGLLPAGASAAAALAYGLLPLIYAYFPPAPAYIHYSPALDANPLTDSIKQPLHLIWDGTASKDHPLDLICSVSSSLPDAAAGAGCALALREGEILRTPPRVLPAGRYRFLFSLAPVAGCTDGRVGLQVTTPRRTLPISKASVVLGGRLQVSIDALIGADIDDGVVLQATSLEGDRCASLTQASILREDDAR